MPTPGHPVPMDIDASKRKPLSDASCYRCKRTGHWAKDCPDRFDVRQLSNDELQEILQDRLVKLDVVAEDSDQHAEPMPNKDFLPDSE
jgi:hypothetical protein